MANFLITNRIENPDDIVRFDHDGYKFAKGESSPDKPVFARSEKRRKPLKKIYFSKETDFLLLHFQPRLYRFSLHVTVVS